MRVERSFWVQFMLSLSFSADTSKPVDGWISWVCSKVFNYRISGMLTIAFDINWFDFINCIPITGNLRCIIAALHAMQLIISKVLIRCPRINQQQVLSPCLLFVTSNQALVIMSVSQTLRRTPDGGNVCNFSLNKSHTWPMTFRVNIKVNYYFATHKTVQTTIE